MEKTIDALDRLGGLIREMPPDQLESLAQNARNQNSWFTPENVKQALIGATNYLNGAKLREWIAAYTPVSKPKKIGLVLAGNIPLVGLHDVICVLMSGHQAIVKPSSKDTVLLTYLLEQLHMIDEEIAARITMTDQLREPEAIIATGSDNTARYFHQYFAKYPHIIRKNRSSAAVIRGNETGRDLYGLGKDIFSYFGLGCRNVSKLYVPEGYDFHSFFEAIAPWSNVMEHHKYHNNYDYNKSILLVNKEKHLDNGFLLLQESEHLVSPISVLYYEYYMQDDPSDKLQKHSDKIQCVVSNGGWYSESLAIGQAQMPELWDYADRVDTMAFLCSL